eukprot:4634105-Pyramimonas_sp.AAC.1
MECGRIVMECGRIVMECGVSPQTGGWSVREYLDGLAHVPAAQEANKELPRVVRPRGADHGPKQIVVGQPPSRGAVDGAVDGAAYGVVRQQHAVHQRAHRCAHPWRPGPEGVRMGFVGQV